MDIYADNSGEKTFFSIIYKMLGELDERGRFDTETLHQLKCTYQKLTEEKQEKCLGMLYEMMRDNYAAVIYLTAVILRETGDKKALRYVIRLLASEEYPLWERLNDSSQLRMYLFTGNPFRENEAYDGLKRVYEGFIKEIQYKINHFLPFVPFEKRTKKVILVASQLINKYHAPTTYVRRICSCLEKMGYEAECFVCHFYGVDGYWNWNKGFYSQNFMHETGSFEQIFENEKIKGYNLELHGADYIETLRSAVCMIWEKKPEYVLEVGSETILAGLCREFTTTVTMGMTGALPVTNSSLIVSLSEDFQEEQKLWKTLLDKEQKAISVRFTVHDQKAQKAESTCQKRDFGISEDAFVIIIAGNRLDLEIKESFEEVLYQILEQEKHFVMAVIGKCPELEKRILKGKWADRFYFLGHQPDFRGAVGIGDVFVNPPRQGGGTGGMFAIMEEVPVITLDHCDVEENAGKEFVCNSIEEMPELVYKYYTDKEFMDRQKANCRKNAMAKTNIDNEAELWKIHDAVKEYAASGAVRQVGGTGK